ncbi:creatininase family protein [[Eubacterium] cellulosolvens]
MKKLSKVESYVMENMTWKEVESKLSKSKTVIIPFGSTEEHGYHLPLSTDYFVAYELAKRVGKKIQALVAPPICYGVCRRGASFQGTITISIDTLRSLTIDIITSLHSQGFRNIIVLPGHLGSAQTIGLELACQKLVKQNENLKIVLIDLSKILEKIPEGIIGEQFGHAGEVETSLMLALDPAIVRMADATDEKPIFPAHLVVRDSRKFMKSGVIGNANAASIEKGTVILELFVNEISKVILGVIKVQS